jgi:hypothetical protein
MAPRGRASRYLPPLSCSQLRAVFLRAMRHGGRVIALRVVRNRTRARLVVGVTDQQAGSWAHPSA